MVWITVSGLAQQTRDVVPLMFWASVADGGPALKRHCVNVYGLLGHGCLKRGIYNALVPHENVILFYTCLSVFIRI